MQGSGHEELIAAELPVLHHSRVCLAASSSTTIVSHRVESEVRLSGPKHLHAYLVRRTLVRFCRGMRKYYSSIMQYQGIYGNITSAPLSHLRRKTIPKRKDPREHRTLRNSAQSKPLHAEGTRLSNWNLQLVSRMHQTKIGTWHLDPASYEDRTDNWYTSLDSLGIFTATGPHVKTVYFRESLGVLKPYTEQS